MALPPNAVKKHLSTFTVPAGTLFGFKALPTASFDIPTHSGPSQEWGGIYPQLSFQQALAYLPNQFERGFTEACIVTLTTKTDVRAILYLDSMFLEGSVDGAVKAELARKSINTLFEKSQQPPLSSNLPLVDALGAANAALCVFDAEGLELVLPKSMFCSDWFEMRQLFVFEADTRIPCMVGRVVGHTFMKSVLQDVRSLSKELETGLERCRCTAMEELVENALNTPWHT